MKILGQTRASAAHKNPFNPTTTVIEFALPKASEVRLDVYNVLGRRIITLLDERRTAGYHTVSWDGKGSNGRALASGLYFYRIVAEDFIRTKKMLLLK